MNLTLTGNIFLSIIKRIWFKITQNSLTIKTLPLYLRNPSVVLETYKLQITIPLPSFAKFRLVNC